MLETLHPSKRTEASALRDIGRKAFTLIELLIVIAIISLLAGLVYGGIILARGRALEGLAMSQISAIELALGNYMADEGALPGSGEPDTGENAFHILYGALAGQPKPHGPGGRSSPYLQFKEEDIVVEDPASGGWRKPTRTEMRDDHIKKNLLDPWGHPFVYRFEERARGRPPAALIYSLGPNEADDTAGGDDHGDDIGNW